MWICGRFERKVFNAGNIYLRLWLCWLSFEADKVVLETCYCDCCAGATAHVFTHFRVIVIRKVLKDWEIVNVLVVSTVLLTISTCFSAIDRPLAHSTASIHFYASPLLIEGGRGGGKWRRGWLDYWPACFSDLCLLFWHELLSCFSNLKRSWVSLSSRRFRQL